MLLGFYLHTWNAPCTTLRAIRRVMSACAAVGTSNARTTETPQATKYTHFPPYFWARNPPSIWVAQ